MQWKAPGAPREEIGWQSPRDERSNPVLSRWLATLLVGSSWLLLSNHCALATLTPTAESAPEMSGCPMHSAPAKKTPAAKTPCCKDVRAVVAKCLKANPATRVIAVDEHVTQTFALAPRLTLEIAALDTGPPAFSSFAESVLQESMLSHAPPVS